MREWSLTTVGEAFNVNPSRPLKRGAVSPFIPMDVLPPHARSVERIESREYTGTGMRFCNGDTLIARITPCLENGKTAFVFGLRDGEVAHGSTEYIVLSGKPEESDSLFAYYLARSPEFRRYAIGQMEGTSGRQRVPSSAIERFPVTLPSLPEQRAIAHILGTLDDKIELNRQQNETLEAMARALFKAWFVDFEPVRAKMDGRWQRGQTLPGLPAHLYDHFPDRLVESELGEIPEGWEVTSVDDEFDVTMGQSPPGNTYNETGEGLPFYQGRADFEFRFPKRRVYCTAPTRFARNGDTLVSVRAPVGDINMASEDCAIGRGVAAVRHKTGSRSYTYQFMSSISDVFARFDSEGTVFGSIGKKDFHSIAHVKPPRDLVLAYEKLAAQPDDQIERNERESRILAQLRDTLLPKLISGELRVPDAERIVGATL